MKFNKNYTLLALVGLLCFGTMSCQEDEIEIIEEQIEEEQEEEEEEEESDTQNSPWDSEVFGTYLAGNEFQVDNDGEGAHNWDADEYLNEPMDNGLNINEFLWEQGGYIELLCPSGDSRRRTEFREQMDRDLSEVNEMEFTCQFFNVNESKVIFAQIHNDGGVSRPYMTAFIEEGEIFIERTDSPVNSGSSRYENALEFDEDHIYRVVYESVDGTTDMSITVTDEDASETISNTWEMPAEWEAFNGQFYFKFGSYMPRGGSDSTRTQIQTLELSGY